MSPSNCSGVDILKTVLQAHFKGHFYNGMYHIFSFLNCILKVCYCVQVPSVDADKIAWLRKRKLGFAVQVPVVLLLACWLAALLVFGQLVWHWGRAPPPAAASPALAVEPVPATDCVMDLRKVVQGVHRYSWQTKLTLVLTWNLVRFPVEALDAVQKAPPPPPALTDDQFYAATGYEFLILVLVHSCVFVICVILAGLWRVAGFCLWRFEAVLIRRKDSRVPDFESGQL